MADIPLNHRDIINNVYDREKNVLKTSANVEFDASQINIGDVGLVDINEVSINPATSEKQQEIINAVNSNNITSYNFIQKSVEATYIYYGYAEDNVWQIKRKEISTGIWTISLGTGLYDTAWADRANKTYGYY